MTTSLRFATGCLLPLILASSVLAQEIRISSNEYTLNGDLVVADGRQLSESAVLIVHGTLGHKDMELIETLQDAFQEAGQNSLAINLSLNIDDRNGFYPCDVLHTHRSSDALDEIGLWVDWLAEQGVDEVVVLGHSRGANQVARFVAEMKRNIKAAVLLAPPASNSRADTRVLQGTATGFADEILRDIDFLHCENANVNASTYVSYYGSDAVTDTISLMREIDVPTLVVSGSEDEGSTDLSSRMQTVENSVVSHVEIPGAGHFFRDLYAYDVVDLVVEHVERQTKPRLVALASSLRDDGQVSRLTGQAIVVFVSQRACEYCELLRRRILFPMVRAGEFDDRVILRELSLDPGFEFSDFDGATISGRDFAARYNVYVTPTLLFLDGQGNSLVDALVGTSNIELYEFYLNRAIDTATEELLRIQ